MDKGRAASALAHARWENASDEQREEVGQALAEARKAIFPEQRSANCEESFASSMGEEAEGEVK
jgi:hypothetical protein